MRKFPLFFILLIALCSSCSKRDNRLFRWNDLSPETDSLVQKIEWGMINIYPDDSILKMITELEKNSDILKTNPETPLILRGKIFLKLGLKDSANMVLEKAERFCDSSKHQYEKHRINILKERVKDNPTFNDFENLGKARKFAISTKDTFLLGMVDNAMGIVLHSLSDTTSRIFTEEALICYKALNLNLYARSMELNLLPIIYKEDIRAFKSTIDKLKKMIH